MVVNFRMLVNKPSNKIPPKSSLKVGNSPNDKTGQNGTQLARGVNLRVLNKMAKI